MNCYTESFSQNCSLIAPSRLSGCMFIYCSIAPPWLILSHIPLLIFLFCLSSTKNMKKLLASQAALATVWRALSLGCLSPACSSQTGELSLPPAGNTSTAPAKETVEIRPSCQRVPEELQDTPQPKSVMWPQVIVRILFLDLYRKTYFACILDFLLLPLLLHKHRRSTDAHETFWDPLFWGQVAALCAQYSLWNSV